MTKRMMLVFAGLLFASWGLAACNTTEGLGKDVENTGEAVQDAARDAK